jgi:ribonuclease BN (tRNA processing enzyme)
MKVVCLGTGGFHPSETSHTACYVIPDLSLVFDAGTGFFRAITLLRSPTLDIFLSHGHLDHIGGLPCLEDVFRIPSTKTVRLHASERVLDSVDLLFSDPFFPNRPPFERVPLTLDPFTLSSGALVTAFPLKHTTECFGFRVDVAGSSFAYITDTASDPNSPYLANIAGVGLLFHELWADAGVDVSRAGHTDAGNLAKVCRVVKAKQVVTIHHRPGDDREVPLATLRKEVPEAKAAHDLEEFEF